jgi:hypothetical protein
MKPSIAEREALADVLAVAEGRFDLVAEHPRIVGVSWAPTKRLGSPGLPDPARSAYRDCRWYPR